MSYGATDGLSSVALKMASVAARGSMGSAHREEDRTALVASKPTTIALRWASLDEGSFMGI